jgi:hypothetical protein
MEKSSASPALDDIPDLVGEHTFPYSYLNYRDELRMKATVAAVAGRPCIKFEDSNKWYPIMYSHVKDLKAVPHLWKQHEGTCYFHAAMNAVLNQSHFVTALLKHIDARLAKNPYARRIGESNLAATERRFGTRQMCMMSNNAPSFKPSAANMALILSKIDKDEKLRDWVRGVIVSNMFRSALSRQARNKKHWHDTTYAVNAQIQALLGVWKEDNMAHYSSATKRKDNNVGRGGTPDTALRNVLMACGVPVRHDKADFRVVGMHIREYYPLLRARVPKCGTTLVATYRHFDIVNPQEKDPEWADGSASGMVTIRTSGGHGVAYAVQGKQRVILDSQGYTHTPEENRFYHRVGVDNYMYSPMYTCCT